MLAQCDIIDVVRGRLRDAGWSAGVVVTHVAKAADTTSLFAHPSRWRDDSPTGVWVRYRSPSSNHVCWVGIPEGLDISTAIIPTRTLIEINGKQFDDSEIQRRDCSNTLF